MFRSLFSKSLLFTSLNIVILGLILTVSSYFIQEQLLMKNLEQQAKGITSLWKETFLLHDIKEAQGTQQNIAALRRLSKQLTKISDHNPNVAQGYLIRPAISGEKTQILALPEQMLKYGIKSGEIYRHPPQWNHAFRELLSSKTAQNTGIYTDDFGTWFTILEPILDSNQSIVAVFAIDINASIITDGQLWLLGQLSITLIVFLLIIVLIQFITLQSILNPLKILFQAITQVGEGNLDVEIKAKKKDAFGTLSRHFNRMIYRLKLLFAQLMESEERYRLIAENSSDMIKIVNHEGIIEYASPSHEQILGFDLEEVVGNRYDQNVLSDDLTLVQKSFLETIESNRPIRIEFRRYHKNDEWIWVEETFHPVTNEDGTLRHIMIVGREIGERKLYEEQLQHLAYYDTLTNIPNRRYFQEKLKQLLQKAKLEDSSFAILFMDCDRFKWINDTLGHDAGDKILQEFAHRINVSLRDQDLLARFGGDEFIVYIGDIQSKEEVEEVIQNINQTLKLPLKYKDHELTFTSSIGVAIYPKDGTDEEMLIRNADQALYRAKKNGRNTVQFYTSEIETSTQMILGNRLISAMKNDELYLEYQPQVEIATNKIIGYEVLIRWNEPEMGLISPAQFIRIAEKNGMIREVTNWVLQSVCKTLGEWKRLGFPLVKLSVNISAFDFYRQGLVEQIAQYINQYQVDPEYLELEITESAIMDNITNAITILNKLREMGIKTAIDDFGVGLSSLTYLKQLPVHKLKIDKSFIEDVPNNPKDAKILETIIHMGQTLGLEVLVEGVEREEQFRFLTQYHVAAQGYFFSRPVSIEKIELVR